MSNRTLGHPAKVEEEFSLPLFLMTVGASFAGLVALVKFVAPESVWLAQIFASPLQYLAVFLAVTLLNCFIEYVFHRYVLHKPVVPFLSRFYRQHTLHHSLTRIGRRRTPGGREVPFVENIYPITEAKQGEASFFPWYTFAVFAVIMTPLFALAQWLAPAEPWFLAGYAAFAGSLFFYEVFHAIEHWSFEKWGRLLEHRHFGWFWRKAYSFHLRHHAVIDCNEAISGFFTLPVADWTFGTFILPKTLYPQGDEWQASEFTSPRPCALVRWADAKSDGIVQRRRAQGPAVRSAEPRVYTRGEQWAHALTHGAGLIGSVGVAVLLVTLASLRGNAWHVVSFVVFGVTLVLLYAAFATFRRTRRAEGRKLFQGYNHAAIFLLIAGTATPFLLGSVRGPWGWSLFGVVWGLCLTGAGFRLVCTGPWRAVATFAYLALAVLALIAIKPLLASLPSGALWLLLAGALSYVIGTLFHRWQRLHYHQVVRQAFAFGGSACHLVAVLIFVLPAGR
jgi:hemolysin III